MSFCGGDRIFGHALIASETVALQLFVSSDEVGEFVRVDLMCTLIPEEFLTVKLQSSFCEYAYPASEFPKFFDIVIIGCVALYIRLHMHRKVKLLKEEPFFEYPP